MCKTKVKVSISIKTLSGGIRLCIVYNVKLCTQGSDIRYIYWDSAMICVCLCLSPRIGQKKCNFPTLCVCFLLRDVYRYQLIAHSMQWLSLGDVYQHQPTSHSRQCFSLCDLYRYNPLSHSMQWFSLWNIYQSLPISHSVLWFSLCDVY